MKTAIIFCSKHGAVEKIAGMIAEKLDYKQVEIINLEKRNNIDVNQFDCIIIGGSIYFGEIQKKIKTFCEENLNILMRKKTALFISCLTKEQEMDEFNNAFPEALRTHSFAMGLMGGELIYSKLGLLEKIAIKFVGKDSNDVHELNYEAINEFTLKVKEEINLAKKELLTY